MDTRNNSFIAPRFLIGSAIILLGVILLLGNLDIINAYDYFRLWPALLIIIGIAYLFNCRHGSGLFWGIVLIFIGSGMLLDRLDYISFSIWSYWPLVLVFIGIMMILKATSHRTQYFARTGNIDTNSYIKAITILGGYKLMNNSQDFKGGDLTAVLGGLEVDLSDASIKGEAVIDIFALMGGIEVRVPEDWTVTIDGFPFMGGFEDKTRPPKESAKHLIIKGTAVMGGLEIKN